MRKSRFTDWGSVAPNRKPELESGQTFENRETGNRTLRPPFIPAVMRGWTVETTLRQSPTACGSGAREGQGFGIGIGPHWLFPMRGAWRLRSATLLPLSVNGIIAGASFAL
ncbi:hypothetical protein AVJ23_21245 [Pseudoponticoccus marisrubri]|uniref:Uncharacterized protein n=1 Tax=Pseudoponticoccus marisrubri TaxID=1685382 RepID=A0A0W7WE21_9RHOB|nr:hypothetical protein AVJ23_21245 [Pseudoponticoccus marisrubri]